jgi:hypothetical protein
VVDNVRSDNEGDKANGRKTDPIAITSFYCVIVFFLFVAFVIAIVKSSAEPKAGGVLVFLGLALLSAALSVLFGIIAFLTIRFSGGRRKGYRLAAVGPMLFVGFPIAWGYWNQTAPGRKMTCSSQRTRLQTDFVWIGRILEAYTRDFGECPPASKMDLRDLEDILRNRIIDSAWLKYPNLMKAKGGWFDGFPADPFIRREHRTLRYCAWQKKDWILWSAGPDRDYDLNEGNIGAVLGTDQDKPTSQSLLAITYDATNGTLSSGDIWFRGEDYRLREQNATSHLEHTDVKHDEFSQ